MVETTQLGVFSLNPKRKQRLELIYDLHLQGWSNKQITNHLNTKNLKTLEQKNNTLQNWFGWLFINLKIDYLENLIEY